MAGFLSSDIIHCVFASLPDFATLLSTVLVSKSFHEVFQAHPSSILASVAKTQLGPELLPCAIRLAYFDRGEYLASRADYVQNFPSEKRFFQDDAPVVASHVARLVRNESVMTELELFFSTTRVLLSIHHSWQYTDGFIGNRYKDRASGSQSLLNSRESLLFRRALYRWWLMINLFPPRYLRPAPTAGGDAVGEGTDSDDSDGGDTGDDDDADSPDLYLRKSQHLRDAFLRGFSDDEVAEMSQVHNFMTFVSCHIRRAMPDSTIHQRGSSVLICFVPRLTNS